MADQTPHHQVLRLENGSDDRSGDGFDVGSGRVTAHQPNKKTRYRLFLVFALVCLVIFIALLYFVVTSRDGNLLSCIEAPSPTLSSPPNSSSTVEVTDPLTDCPPIYCPEVFTSPPSSSSPSAESPPEYSKLIQHLVGIYEDQESRDDYHVIRQCKTHTGIGNVLMGLTTKLVWSLFGDFSIYVDFNILKDSRTPFFNYFLPRHPTLARLMTLQRSDPTGPRTRCDSRWVKEPLQGLRIWGSCSPGCVAFRDYETPFPRLVDLYGSHLSSTDFEEKGQICIQECFNDSPWSHWTCSSDRWRFFCEELEICNGLEKFIPFHLKVECNDKEKMEPMFGFQSIGFRLLGNVFSEIFDLHPRLKERFDSFIELMTGNGEKLIVVQMRNSWMKPKGPIHIAAGYPAFISCLETVLADLREQISSSSSSSSSYSVYLGGELVIPDSIIEQFRNVDPEKKTKIFTRFDYSLEKMKHLKNLNYKLDANKVSDDKKEAIAVSIAFDFKLLGVADIAIMTFGSTWGTLGFSTNEKKNAWPPYVVYPSEKYPFLPGKCKRPRMLMSEYNRIDVLSNKHRNNEQSWVWNLDSLKSVYEKWN